MVQDVKPTGIIMKMHESLLKKRPKDLHGILLCTDATYNITFLMNVH